MLDFGVRPFFTRFTSGPGEQGPAHRLAVSACPECGLVQLDRPASPEALFDAFVWRSSWTSSSLFEAMADMLAGHLPLGNASRILDVGANDGTLLSVLRSRGFTRLLGVEPSSGPLTYARERGLDMEQAFFTPEVARRLAGERGPFQALVCTRVLQHVEDLASFQEAVRLALAPGGVTLFHMPDFDAHMEILDYGFFSEVTLNYFTLATTQRLMAGCGLELLEVKSLTCGDDTLLVVGRKRDRDASSLESHCAAGLAFERAARFASGWEDFRRSLRGFFARPGVGRAALYGTGTRSISLASLAGIGGCFAYAVDDRLEKQGLHIPGMGIQVRPASFLVEDPVDTVVFGLPWEHEEKVMRACQELSPAASSYLSILPPSPRLPTFWRAP